MDVVWNTTRKVNNVYRRMFRHLAAQSVFNESGGIPFLGPKSAAEELVLGLKEDHPSSIYKALRVSEDFTYSVEYGLTTINEIPQYDLFVNGEFIGFYPTEVEALRDLIDHDSFPWFREA